MTCKECKYFRAQLCFDEKSNRNTNPDGEACEAFSPADLPNKSVRMILKTFLPDSDIDQTIEAEKKTGCILEQQKSIGKGCPGRIRFYSLLASGTPCSFSRFGLYGVKSW